MIAVEDLKDGQAYSGSCRNSSYAIWSSRRRLFIYIREKFGQLGVEGCRHKDEHVSGDGDYFIPDCAVPNERLLAVFGQECLSAIRWQTEPR